VADGARTHDNWNHNPGLYQLSYSHHRDLKKTGLPDRNRTCNPQLRRLVLYPVELRADFGYKTLHLDILKYFGLTFIYQPADIKYQRADLFGRRGEIRTPDILLPKQARYQATLHAEEAVI
jgi:hypothetical protein